MKPLKLHGISWMGCFESLFLRHIPRSPLCSREARRLRCVHRTLSVVEKAIDEARTGGPAGRHGLALAERRGASRRKLGASAALIMLGDRDGRQRRIAVDTGSVRQGRVRPE